MNLVVLDHFHQYPIQKPEKLLLQLVEEVGELSAAFNRSKGNIEDEAGDVINLVSMFCKSIGLDPLEIANSKHYKSHGCK